MSISQREAVRLRKRVQQLEDEINRQRRVWAQEWVGGTNLGSILRDKDWLTGRIDGARMLKHAVVCTQDDNGRINFYALPLPKDNP